MSHDDFDLIPRNRARTQGAGSEPPAPPDYEPYADPPPRRNWGWLITLAVVAFLFFSIGAAIITVRDRLGQTPTPAPTAFVGVATPSILPTGWLATLAARGTPTATVALLITTPTPGQTVTPTPSPTVPPTPCAQPPAAFAAAAFIQSLFGCPLGGSQIVWAAWEPFERGSMLWRSDANRSFVFTLDGHWHVIDAGWNGEPVPSRGDPPPGMVQPERGFGWVWGTQDDVFQALGWATADEKGFCAEVQDFEHGFFMQSSAAASCTADSLYNNAGAADWQPLFVAAHETGAWSGTLGGRPVAAATQAAPPLSPAPPATAAAATPTQGLSVAARPADHGIFQAARAGAVTLDGDLAEWPAQGWLPMSTLVEGGAGYSGPADASGIFQLLWAPEGLYLAAQVQDDTFRPGPGGTDLWQGDALELQMDAQLTQDFADTAASDDDYQIGIALNSDGRTLQAYRWLPRTIEGAPAMQGAGRSGAAGYTIEALLPWNTFGLNGVQGGQSYGFNLSISDNDADAPRQESVVSASPARTTYDDPAEWGTLVLLP